MYPSGFHLRNANVTKGKLNLKIEFVLSYGVNLIEFNYFFYLHLGNSIVSHLFLIEDIGTAGHGEHVSV